MQARLQAKIVGFGCMPVRLNNGRRFKRNRKFADSPLEGAGFEPAVPGESGFDFAREVRGRTESKIEFRRFCLGLQLDLLGYGKRVAMLVRAQFHGCSAR